MIFKSSTMIYLKNPQFIDIMVNENLSTGERDRIAASIVDQQLSMVKLSTSLICLCVLYAVLFCFGLLGNLWVMGVVLYILKTFRSTFVANKNVFLYILCLSIIDATLLSNLPMLISDIYWYHWMFGRTLCKIYWISESGTKILSLFVLTSFTFDRYLAVCRHGKQFRVRTMYGTGCLLVIFMIFANLLLTPVHMYAERFVVYEHFLYNNTTFKMAIPKCMLDMTPSLTLTFTIYTFIAAFCVPSALISYFYAKILYYVHKHASSFQNQPSRQRARRVTRVALSVVAFYFACWSPYWILNLYAALRSTAAPPALSEHQQQHDEDTASIQIMHFIHAFVYVNSALNWVLYALLNSRVKESRHLALERSRSMSMNRSRRGRYDDKSALMTSDKTRSRKRPAANDTFSKLDHQGNGCCDSSTLPLNDSNINLVRLDSPNVVVDHVQ